MDMLSVLMMITMECLFLQEVVDETEGGEMNAHTSMVLVSIVDTETWSKTDAGLENWRRRWHGELENTLEKAQEVSTQRNAGE